MFSQKQIDDFGEAIDELSVSVSKYIETHEMSKYVFFWQDAKEAKDVKSEFKEFLPMVTGDLGRLHFHLSKLVEAKECKEPMREVLDQVNKEIKMLKRKAVDDKNLVELCEKVNTQLEEFSKKINGLLPGLGLKQ